MAVEDDDVEDDPIDPRTCIPTVDRTLRAAKKRDLNFDFEKDKEKGSLEVRKLFPRCCFSGPHIFIRGIFCS